MCSKLMQIYQKRTPTFLAEITILIASLLLIIQHPHSQECGIQNNLHTFSWAVFILAVTEIALKLIVFTVIYFLNREIVNSYSTIVLVLAALAHIALWIYSIVLLGNEELQACGVRNRYFVKCYVFIYGAMIVGGTAFFVLLMIPAVGVTFLAYRNSKREGEEEQF